MPAPPDLPSKSAVDRAGRLSADALVPPEQVVGDSTRLEFWADPFEDHARFLELAATVRAWRAAHAEPLRRTSANLRHYVRDVPDAQVAQRLKKFGTIVDKLRRFETMRLSRMEDIGGCRVVVPDLATARHLAHRLKRNWTIARDRDYVGSPKLDGYRARHLVATKGGRFVEVQIRTRLQDLWANTVERDGRRWGVEFKSGAGDARARDQYRKMSDLLAAEERGEALDPRAIADLLATFDPPGGA